MIGMVAIVAPAIAPAIGALLLQVGDWGLVFLFLGAYALFLLPLLQATVFRGPHRPPGGADGLGFLARYPGVLQPRSARPYIFWQTASFGGLIIFVTYASYIYLGHFAQSRAAFTGLFACNIVAIFACNLANRVLLNRLQPRQIMVAATWVQAASGLALLLIVLLDGPVQAFLPAMMVYAGMLGAISPNIQACYLESFPRSAASAAAVMGATQFGLGGAASALSNLLPEALLSVVACICEPGLHVVVATQCRPVRHRAPAGRRGIAAVFAGQGRGYPLQFCPSFHMPGPRSWHRFYLRVTRADSMRKSEMWCPPSRFFSARAAKVRR